MESTGEESSVTFCNKLFFYELLAPHPTPKLEDHPLLAVHDCLFNIFTAALHIWRPSPLSETRDMPFRSDKDPHNMGRKVV
jgi:hypothetical protein